MPSENITEAWLAKIAADEDRGKPAAIDGKEREKYWDESLPGFGVLVGKRFATFLVQHRVNGRQKLKTIGRYGRPGADGAPWTVARARRVAMRLLGSMEQGLDPSPEPRKAPTLRDAFAAHVARLEAKKRSAATVVTFKKSMPYVEAWLDRPLADLTGEELEKIHARIRRDTKPRAGARNEKGAPLANRVITNVGTAWSSLNKKLGGKLGNWNPARSVDKVTLEAKRVRIDDLRDWHARVETMRNPIQRDGLMVALFTGLRSEDVRTIQWEHADLVARTLALPDPKGGEARAFTIPLPVTCVEILERRARDNAKDLGRDEGGGGWAFPAVNDDGEIGPIGDLRQQVHNGKKHSRFPVEDVHTLRRTYTSVAQEAGVSELDQHVLTNHRFAGGNVHQTYIAQHIDHLAECQAKIEAALWQRLKPDPKATKARGRLRAV